MKKLCHVEKRQARRFPISLPLVETFLIAFTIGGCAAGPAFQPVTDPTIRVEGRGFTALPPQGSDWYVSRQGPNDVVFNKLLPEYREGDSRSTSHTFGVGVMVLHPEVRTANSSQEFPSAVEEHFRGTLTEGRFRLVSLQTRPFGPQGSHCAGYDVVQEERDNPRWPGIVLEMTNHGFVCLDASATFIVNAFYSERLPQGDASMLDEALKGEVEPFLANVVVTPFTDPSAEPSVASQPVMPVPAEAGNASGEASIYVFHSPASAAVKGFGALALKRAVFYVDDAKVGTLPEGRHTRIAVTLGLHKVQVKVSICGLPGLSTGEQNVAVKGGETSYLHYYETLEGGSRTIICLRWTRPLARTGLPQRKT